MHPHNVNRMAGPPALTICTQCSENGVKDDLSLQPEQDMESLRRALAQSLESLAHERDARTAAERMSALKDEFLAVVSHELRNPLAAIRGWAHLLRRAVDPEDYEKGLDVIEQSVMAQARLIDDLLDMSRITSGQLRLDIETVEPRSFIDAAVEAVRPAAEAKMIRIRKLLDLTAGPIAGDANRLQQVMANLLSNAVKFTPEHGSVEVNLRRLNDQVEISVADTGIGISASFLPHVFDRFRQADAPARQRHEGLGLGLAIVKHLVELHRGAVRAESPGEGRGATFVVLLPLLLP
jgi:signal transduction histidine kinase